LIYDIQDVGARFYTYITTLGYLIEEGAKARLPVFVLGPTESDQMELT